MYLVSWFVGFAFGTDYVRSTNKLAQKPSTVVPFQNLRRNIYNISPETFHSRDAGRRPLD